MSAARDLRIYHRLQVAAHRVRKAADRALLTSADITTAQAAVLAIVGRAGAVTQRDVARQLGLNESAITAMVGRLVRMDLLDRKSDHRDARVWRVSLTNQGSIAVKNNSKLMRTINATIEAVLLPEEIEQLADCLGRIAAAFDAE